MDKKKSFEKLNKLVKDKGISYYALSKSTGLPNSLFSEWKSGKSVPKVDKLKKIADYFGVSVEYFLVE